MLVTMATSAGKLQEGAVTLIRLDHHPVAPAEPRVGAVGVDDAAIDDGRIEPAGVEQGRDERGRRRLAMRAGDRDALLEPHQLGEHLRAAHDGQALLARCDELGVVALDRGRDDDDGGLAERARIMTDGHARSFFDEPLHIGVFGGVRALDAVALIEQHLGDAGHANSANADEMNGPKLARQLHRGSCSFATPRA